MKSWMYTFCVVVCVVVLGCSEPLPPSEKKTENILSDGAIEQTREESHEKGKEIVSEKKANEENLPETPQEKKLEADLDRCQGGKNELPELCDGIDNNCDGQIDEGCKVCTPSGLVPVFDFSGHTDSVSWIEVSKNEKYALTASHNEASLFVWDLVNQKLLYRFPYSNKTSLNSFAFSFDQQEVLLRTSIKLQRFSLATGLLNQEISLPYDNSTTKIIPLQDGKTALMVSSFHKEFSLLDIMTWKSTQTWNEHTDYVVSLEINEAKKLILSASSKEVLLFDSTSTQSKQKWTFTDLIRGASLNQDATQIVVSTLQKRIVIDLATSQQQEFLVADIKKAVTSTTFSLNESSYARFGEKDQMLVPFLGGVVIWDIVKNALVNVFQEPYMANPTDVFVFLPQSKALLQGFRSGFLYWQSLDKKTVFSLDGTSLINGLDSKNQRISTYSKAGKQIGIFSLKDQKKTISLSVSHDPPSGRTFRLQWSLDGKQVASYVPKYHTNTKTNVWNLSHPKPIATIGSRGKVFFTNKGFLYATYSEVLLLDLTTQKAKSLFRETYVEDLWLSADQKFLLIQKGSELVVFDWTTEKELYRLTYKDVSGKDTLGSFNSDFEIFFSPDNQSFATILFSPNKAVKHWKLASKKELATASLEAHRVIQDRSLTLIWLLSWDSVTQKSMLQSFSLKDSKLGASYDVSAWSSMLSNSTLLELTTWGDENHLLLSTQQKLIHWDLKNQKEIQQWTFPSEIYETFRDNPTISFSTGTQLSKMTCKE